MEIFSTSNSELQRDEGMEQIVYSKLRAAMYHPVLFQRRPEPSMVVSLVTAIETSFRTVL